MDLRNFCSLSPVTPSDKFSEVALNTKSGRLGGCDSTPCGSSQHRLCHVMVDPSSACQLSGLGMFTIYWACVSQTPMRSTLLCMPCGVRKSTTAPQGQTWEAKRVNSRSINSTSALVVLALGHRVNFWSTTSLHPKTIPPCCAARKQPCRTMSCRASTLRGSSPEQTQLGQ